MTVADLVIEELAASEAAALARIEELEAEVTALRAELLITHSERGIWRQMTSEALTMTTRASSHLDMARAQIRRTDRELGRAA